MSEMQVARGECRGTVAQVSAAQQRAGRIRSHVAGAAQEYAQAVLDRDWDVLGYAGVAGWAADQFGAHRFARETRQQVAEILSASGQTVRQIAAATGVSKSVAGDDVSRVRKPDTSSHNRRSQAASQREERRRQGDAHPPDCSCAACQAARPEGYRVPDPAVTGDREESPDLPREEYARAIGVIDSLQNFRFGLLACEVAGRYGEESLERYARDTRAEYGELCECRQVALAFPEVARRASDLADRFFLRDASAGWFAILAAADEAGGIPVWKVCQAVASQPDRDELARRPWMPAEAREFVRARSAARIAPDQADPPSTPQEPPQAADGPAPAQDGAPQAQVPGREPCRVLAEAKVIFGGDEHWVCAGHLAEMKRREMAFELVQPGRADRFGPGTWAYPGQCEVRVQVPVTTDAEVEDLHKVPA
jgi:hypothetical protein